MKNKILIHAPNIHGGGGETLLKSIVNNVSENYDISVNIHPQYRDENNKWNVINANIISRLIIEIRNIKNTVDYDYVLYFGNLPPLFKLNCPVVVFVQNKYLVDNISTVGLSFRVSIRIFFERLILRLFNNNSQIYIVQSESMKDLLSSVIGENRKIHVLPFCPSYKKIIKKFKPVDKRTSSFVYVATGESHKNHYRLIEAWYLLASFNLRPILHLTIKLNYFQEILRNLNTIYGDLNINIINHDYMSSDEIHDLYNSSDVLIYPSLHESFGLPIVEAMQHNLIIIASELDFVRDIVDPVETFNPQSSKSICLAVMRYMQVDNKNVSIIESKDFLDALSSLIN